MRPRRTPVCSVSRGQVKRTRLSATIGLDSRTATGHALLTAGACSLCLVIAAALDLEHADLAVWTTYLVLAQYSFTSFQKGIERIVGRALGILAGLVLTTWFNEMPLIAIGLIGVLLTGFFYLHFAGRLAYTFLQAGLYLVALFQIGHASPATAVGEAKELFAAIVLGVVVADIVNWAAGVEGDVRIRLGEAPLLPLRIDWLSQSVMLAVTVPITLLGAHAISLPPVPAAISVLVLTITPHLQALIQKGELRIAGLALATIWGLATFLLVGLLPYLPLLCVLVFLGQFIAAYLTLTGGKYAYVGLQMGLVLPMIVVARPNDFGSFTPAAQRLEGILIGLLASIAVASLWPRFPAAATPAAVSPPPPPAMPGEIDT
jgi:Fusaric acid resistance protein family